MILQIPSSWAGERLLFGFLALIVRTGGKQGKLAKGYIILNPANYPPLTGRGRRKWRALTRFGDRCERSN